jgi:hypothetical protein
MLPALRSANSRQDRRIARILIATMIQPAVFDAMRICGDTERTTRHRRFSGNYLKVGFGGVQTESNQRLMYTWA